jgi:hypothetical protein
MVNYCQDAKQKSNHKDDPQRLFEGESHRPNYAKRLLLLFIMQFLVYE